MGLARKSAAALLIGDEILSGSVIDTNTQVLAKYLCDHGVNLQQTRTIRDDVDIIAEHIIALRDSHDIVFTSGGIGPTLDDVTYEGIAKAFGVDLQVHDETEQKMRKMTGKDINEARRRMATFPVGAECLWADGLWTPTVCMGGKVYILAGVPKVFERMLSCVDAKRLGSVTRRESKVIYTKQLEGDIAEGLKKVANEFQDIKLGSYPKTSNEGEWRVRVVIEGDGKEMVEQAAERIRMEIGGWV